MRVSPHGEILSGILKSDTWKFMMVNFIYTLRLIAVFPPSVLTPDMKQFRKIILKVFLRLIYFTSWPWLNVFLLKELRLLTSSAKMYVFKTKYSQTYSNYLKTLHLQKVYFLTPKIWSGTSSSTTSQQQINWVHTVQFTQIHILKTTFVFLTSIRL